MLFRKSFAEIEKWFELDEKALLIDGARHFGTAVKETMRKGAQSAIS
jgi:hypothetical protein